MAEWLMPRCVVCGEELDLGEHLERLNEHAGLVERLRDAAPSIWDIVCPACKSDPDRLEEHLSGQSPEENRERMAAEIRRRTGGGR